MDLAGARITGRLDLTGAKVEAPLRLRRCVFDEPVVFDHAELGSVNLDGSRLPGMDAESLQVRRWFGMRDAQVAGDAWLHHIRVDGGLDLGGTRFGGPVNLQHAVVEGDLRLGQGAAYASGLRLDRARIAGDLNIARATAHAPPDGEAIRASGMTVGGGLWAHDLVAEGTVYLIGVRVASAITLQHSTLRCPGGAALLLIEAQTAMLTLRPSPASAGTIVLRDAHVGRLIDDPAGWPDACRIELAAALRRDGGEQEAREVLRVRERLRHRAMGRLGAVWGAVQDIVIGFGYRPARAALWLILVLAAGSGWFAWTGPLRPVKAGEAPTWDPLLYTLDLLVPLVDLGHERAWDPVGADKAVAVLVMAAGWVLATTVVAGAGRALRR